jgi:predicted RNA-binding protein with RPS1 domain
VLGVVAPTFSPFGAFVQADNDNRSVIRMSNLLQSFNG